MTIIRHAADRMELLDATARTCRATRMATLLCCARSSSRNTPCSFNNPWTAMRVSKPSDARMSAFERQSLRYPPEQPLLRSLVPGPVLRRLAGEFFGNLNGDWSRHRLYEPLFGINVKLPLFVRIITLPLFLITLLALCRLSFFRGSRPE